MDESNRPLNNVVPILKNKTKSQLEYELMVALNQWHEIADRLEAACALLKAMRKDSSSPLHTEQSSDKKTD